MWVWWERNGAAQILEKEGTLQSGDRVRVEVLSSHEAVVYWMIATSSGKLLGSTTEVWERASLVKAGERIALTGSMRLVDPSEGETVVLISCAKGGLEEAEFLRLAEGKEAFLSTMNLPKNCDGQKLKLR